MICPAFALALSLPWSFSSCLHRQACKDAQLTEEQLHALQRQQHHHQAFDQAARLEHLRERQIIEQQHKDAETAAALMRQQIEAMQPGTAWHTPPVAPVDPAWGVSDGQTDSILAVRLMRDLCSRSC